MGRCPRPGGFWHPINIQLLRLFASAGLQPEGPRTQSHNGRGYRACIISRALIGVIKRSIESKAVKSCCTARCFLHRGSGLCEKKKKKKKIYPDTFCRTTASLPMAKPSADSVCVFCVCGVQVWSVRVSQIELFGLEIRRNEITLILAVKSLLMQLCSS